jgi:hypothetical protein
MICTRGCGWAGVAPFRHELCPACKDGLRLARDIDDRANAIGQHAARRTLVRVDAWYEYRERAFCVELCIIPNADRDDELSVRGIIDARVFEEPAGLDLFDYEINDLREQLVRHMAAVAMKVRVRRRPGGPRPG